MDRNQYQWNETQDFSLYSLATTSLDTLLNIDTPVRNLINIVHVSSSSSYGLKLCVYYINCIAGIIC